MLAEAGKFFKELIFDPFGRGVGEVSGFQFLAYVAGLGAEILEAADEGIDG